MNVNCPLDVNERLPVVNCQLLWRELSFGRELPCGRELTIIVVNCQLRWRELFYERELQPAVALWLYFK